MNQVVNQLLDCTNMKLNLQSKKSEHVYTSMALWIGPITLLTPFGAFLQSLNF